MKRQVFRFDLNENTRPELFTRFTDFIVKIKDGKYVITVEKQYRERSGAQNKLYWAILNQIENQTGQLSEELHETFKAKYLVDRSARLPRIKSTSELNVIEFNEYITKICVEMAEFGIILDFPEDQR